MVVNSIERTMVNMNVSKAVKKTNSIMSKKQYLIKKLVNVLHNAHLRFIYKNNALMKNKLAEAKITYSK